MRRRRPCPLCCGGLLWKVTRGFFGCGMTEDVVRTQWGPGVMQPDRVSEMWACHHPYAGRSGGGGT